MSRPDVVFDRRVQLLIDQATYNKVAAEAASSGRSVNAVMREAISAAFDDSDDRADELRAVAARRLLERATKRVEEGVDYDGEASLLERSLRLELTYDTEHDGPPAR